MNISQATYWDFKRSKKIDAQYCWKWCYVCTREDGTSSSVFLSYLSTSTAQVLFSLSRVASPALATAQPTHLQESEVLIVQGYGAKDMAKCFPGGLKAVSHESDVQDHQMRRGIECQILSNRVHELFNKMCVCVAPSCHYSLHVTTQMEPLLQHENLKSSWTPFFLSHLLSNPSPNPIGINFKDYSRIWTYIPLPPLLFQPRPLLPFISCWCVVAPDTSCCLPPWCLLKSVTVGSHALKIEAESCQSCAQITSIPFCHIYSKVCRLCHGLQGCPWCASCLPLLFLHLLAFTPCLLYSSHRGLLPSVTYSQHLPSSVFAPFIPHTWNTMPESQRLAPWPHSVRTLSKKQGCPPLFLCLARFLFRRHPYQYSIMYLFF